MKPARSSGWSGRVVLVILLLFGLPAVGAAQKVPGASRKPGSIPRQGECDPTTGRSFGPSRGPGWARTEQYFDFPAALKLTAAERGTVIARLEEFERLFASADAMARPQGFRANPLLQVGGRFVIETGGYGVLASGIGIQLFDGQDPRPGEEAAPVLGAGVNPGASQVSLVRLASDAQGAIYRELPKSGPVSGMPPWHGGLWETGGRGAQ